MHLILFSGNVSFFSVNDSPSIQWNDVIFKTKDKQYHASLTIM